MIVRPGRLGRLARLYSHVYRKELLKLQDFRGFGSHSRAAAAATALITSSQTKASLTRARLDMAI